MSTAAPTTRGGSRYPLVAAGLAAFFLAGFVLAEAVGVPWLSAPPPLWDWAEPLAALAGVGLLLGDAVLPVPASLVMLALGGVFDLPTAAALALLGRAGATLLGFAVGRRLATRVTGPGSARADGLLRRWGALAIVLSRPVPILGETVAVLAGASPMSWRRATLAAVAGALPEAVLFTWAGAQAGRTVLGFAIWTALLAGAAAIWIAGRILGRRRGGTRVEGVNCPGTSRG